MPNRILRSANFKLAMLYAAVFSISALVLVSFIFLSVRDYLEQQARSHIEFEVAQLMGDYKDDGIDELRHDIHERIEASPANRLRYTVRRPDGRLIFDGLAVQGKGWQRFFDNGKETLVHATALAEGYTLIVGADLGLIQDIENAIRNRLFMLLLFVLVVASSGGLLVSRRFLARVDHLGKTAEQIGAGQLSARIPLNGTDDDFDQLGGTINRMLDRIEQLMGEVKHVSTAIAHDLRTPLGHLRQKLERIEQSSVDKKEIREALGILDGALETFNGLLRIAEIESGSRRAGFIHVDLSMLLNRLADAYSPMVEEQGMQLKTSIAPAISIEGDDVLLTQSFSNLIENAIRHSGGKNITMALERNAADCIASVSDDGVGVPVSQHVSLLQPFYRGDASRSTQGNGLGLSLVRAIASLHHAQLTLANTSPGLLISLRFNAL